MEWMPPEALPHVEYGLPSLTYHDQLWAVSNSALSSFLHSRRDYETYYVKRSLPFPGSTKYQELGSAIHCLVLQPELFNAEVTEIPREVLSSSGHRRGKAWEEWKQERGGEILLKASEIELCRKVAGTIRSNKWAGEMLARPGAEEVSIFWEEGGLAMRSRIDYLPRNSPWVIDLKTTSQLWTWQSKAWGFGYHRQAAYYLKAVTAVRGGKFASSLRFAFIVVNTAEPLRCHVYIPSPETLLAGAQEVERGLADLRWCMATQDWSDPQEAGVPLPPPPWAFNEAVDLDLGPEQ